jgi:hypothetical protein
MIAVLEGEAARSDKTDATAQLSSIHHLILKLEDTEHLEKWWRAIKNLLVSGVSLAILVTPLEIAAHIAHTEGHTSGRKQCPPLSSVILGIRRKLLGQPARDESDVSGSLVDRLDSIGMSVLALEQNDSSAEARAWLEKTEVFRTLEDSQIQYGEAWLDIFQAWKDILRTASDWNHASSVQEDAPERHQQSLKDMKHSFDQSIVTLADWIENIQDNGPDARDTLVPNLGRDCGSCTRASATCVWPDDGTISKCNVCRRRGGVCQPRTEDDLRKRKNRMKTKRRNPDAKQFARAELNKSAVSICLEDVHRNWIHGTQFFEAAGMRDVSAGWLRGRKDIEEHSFQNGDGSAEYRGTYVEPWKLRNILDEQDTIKKIRKNMDREFAARRTMQIKSWIEGLDKGLHVPDEAPFRFKDFEGTKVCISMQKPYRNWVHGMNLCQAMGINKPAVWMSVTSNKRNSTLDEGVGAERQPTTTSEGNDQRGALIT